jgi:peptidoglycan/LPS O-acetylase OafA/YrhL
MPRDQLQGALVSSIHGNPGIYAAQFTIGFGCSILGGLIAASIAKERRILNGVLASWLCVGIGVYALAAGKGAEPWPMHVALILLTPVCYALGALLKTKVTRSASASA